jgi:hypothetical protein
VQIISIGIGKGLAASPLPHHRTYGARIRRFGRFSQSEIRTPTGASSPGVPAVSSSQAPGLLRHLAGCHLTAPRQAATPLDRSGLQHARACLRCPLLPPAGRSGRIPPPAVLRRDTLQISRGKLSYRRGIDAGCIKHRPMVDGGLCCGVPACPGCTTPRIRFVSLAPYLRATLPSDPTSRRRSGASLVLRLHEYLDRGLSPPSMTACTAHTPRHEPRGLPRRLHALVSQFRPHLPQRNPEHTEGSGQRHGRRGVQAELSGGPKYHLTHP